MSRSNPRTGTGNPIRKYVSYGAGAGTSSYYDKEKAEKVELESIDFIVLDVLSSITGYDSGTSSAFSSNMVKDIQKESLKVIKTNSGNKSEIFNGLYADFKKKKVAGAKFTANVLSLVDFGNGNEVTNVQISGAALNDWIELVKANPNNAIYDFKITMEKGVLCKTVENKIVEVTKEEEDKLDAVLAKNPRAPRPVWFYSAKLTTTPLTEVELTAAMEADKQIQAYIGTSAPAEPSQPEPTTVDDNPFGQEDEELPF